MWPSEDGNEEAKPLDSGLFGVAAIKDDEFPKTYYRVAKWRRLMPEKYDGDLKGTNAGLFTREPGQPGTPSKLWGTLKNWRTRMPLSYRWFRSDLDKYNGLHSQHDGSHCAHVACSTRSGRPDPLGVLLLCCDPVRAGMGGQQCPARHPHVPEAQSKLRRDLANPMLAIQEAKATQDVSKLWDDSKS